MRNLYQTVKIKKIRQETDKVKSVVLAANLKAKPGQYVMVWLPGQGEKPFAVGDCSPLLLTIAKVGTFTAQLHQLKTGETITFRGPYGSSFQPKGQKLLLVGGGYGVVPLYFLSKKYHKDKDIKVVIGAKTKADLLFVKKLQKLGCSVYVTTQDGSAGFRGLVTDLVEVLLAKEKFDYLAACGPLPMMEKAAQLAFVNKIACQVSLEAHFKCGGIGLCGECSFKGRLVCREGPVFAGKILLKSV